MILLRTIYNQGWRNEETLGDAVVDHRKQAAMALDQTVSTGRPVSVLANWLIPIKHGGAYVFSPTRNDCWNMRPVEKYGAGFQTYKEFPKDKANIANLFFHPRESRQQRHSIIDNGEERVSQGRKVGESMRSLRRHWSLEQRQKSADIWTWISTWSWHPLWVVLPPWLAITWPGSASGHFQPKSIGLWLWPRHLRPMCFKSSMIKISIFRVHLFVPTTLTLLSRGPSSMRVEGRYQENLRRSRPFSFQQHWHQILVAFHFSSFIKQQLNRQSASTWCPVKWRSILDCQVMLTAFQPIRHVSVCPLKAAKVEAPETWEPFAIHIYCSPEQMNPKLESCAFRIGKISRYQGGRCNKAIMEFPSVKIHLHDDVWKLIQRFRTEWQRINIQDYIEGIKIMRSALSFHKDSWDIAAMALARMITRKQKRSKGSRGLHKREKEEEAYNTKKERANLCKQGTWGDSNEISQSHSLYA